MNEHAYWSFSFSPWSILLGGLLVVLASWLAWRGAREDRAPRARHAVELFRVAAAIFLALTLLKPEFVRSRQQTRDPVVQVLIDGSGSMKTLDLVVNDQQVVTREQWLENLKAEAPWSVLSGRYKVEVETFSTPAEKEEDPGTDLHAALIDAANHPGNLRAVLLLSDGDHNKGDELPAEAATALRLQEVPVYTVQVGSNRYLPDLELSQVVAPAYALASESVSIPFSIQSRMDKDAAVTVVLRREDGSVAASRDVVIPARRALHDSMNLPPEAEGEQVYSLELPVQPGELLSDNNRKEFKMAFREETLKVLIIDSIPRWEFRFLHNAMWRDPGVEVKVLLFHPDLGVGEGKNYLSRFPNDMQELSEYDVVFLGDVGIQPGQLTEEQAVMLRGLVKEQGSGLVFLPGMLGNQQSLEGSALEELNPVLMDWSVPKGIGFSLESKLALTSRGTDHLLTMLDPDPAQNAEIWRGLPGFYWHAAVERPRAGSTVLAVHSSTRGDFGRLPLLVTQSVGNGKTLFMGTDAAWRWRRGVEDKYHYRFWGQVVRWMSHQRHLVNDEGIRFFYSPESPRRGQPVFLHATVYDASGYPMKDGKVNVRIQNAGGDVEEFELTPGEGDWGVFTGEFTPATGGEYSIQVASREANRSTETTLLVDSPVREQIGRPVRAPALREIAEITNGRMVAHTQVDEVIRELSLLPDRKPIETRFQLWCHPVWAATLLILLALHWAGRKWLGLI